MLEDDEAANKSLTQSINKKAKYFGMKQLHVGKRNSKTEKHRHKSERLLIPKLVTKFKTW